MSSRNNYVEKSVEKSTEQQHDVLKTIESMIYPSVKELTGFNNESASIKKGFIQRTDNFPVDDIILDMASDIPLPALHTILPVLAEHPEIMNRTNESFIESASYKPQKFKKGYQLVQPDGYHLQAYHLLSRLMSVSDLTPNLYDVYSDNVNSLSNWFPPLEQAISKQSFFKVPKTKHLKLPIELAQFIRIDYQDTSKADRNAFNRFIFDTFELEDDTTYFIKTGNFSSKFQYANAKCSEPREMGEYFQVINNFAMEVGAGHSIDLVVREYIEDKDNRPTIYNGMPLRTEFRAFIDFDSDTLLGTVPYWHKSVMEKGLKNPYIQDSIEKDFMTYLGVKDALEKDFDANIQTVNQHLKDIIPHIDLKGCYSLDVMKNGDDFYIIDMADAHASALSELLPQYPVND